MTGKYKSMGFTKRQIQLLTRIDSSVRNGKPAPAPKSFQKLIERYTSSNEAQR